MAAIAFTSLAELQNQIGNARALDLFDDDEDGVISESDGPVAQALAQANDAVTGIVLLKGWSMASLAELAEDQAIRRYATDILSSYGGRRRPEWFDSNGKGRYHEVGEQARKDLANYALGVFRSRKEVDGAGQNPALQADTNVGAPVFIVSRDPRYPGRPGPGGF